MDKRLTFKSILNCKDVLKSSSIKNGAKLLVVKTLLFFDITSTQHVFFIATFTLESSLKPGH